MDISLPSLFYFHHSCSFQNPEREIHTNTSAYTQILCTHRDLHTKDMDQNFPFFSRKCAKNNFKDFKKTSLYSSTLQTALNISLS